METVPAQNALNRIIAEDLISPVNLPPFDRAAMDGYAVIAEDTYGATTATPVFLRMVGNVQMEMKPEINLGKGEAISIVTGGLMPQGADAVVMVEYTRLREEGNVEICSEVHPAENVAHVGEDIQQGTVTLKKGTRILPQDLGILAALGLAEVAVIRKPRVAVLSTGSELVDQSSKSALKIADVNRPVMMSALQDLGCEPVDLGIVPDEFSLIRSRLEEGLRIADMVIVTAGTSVGPRDIVPKIIDSLGKPGMLVHGVAIRPSMPTGLAVIDGKVIVSLPGYPVSAYIAFLEFVRPLLSELLETEFLPRPKVKARLSRRVAGVLGSRTYVRVRVAETRKGYVVYPVRTSGAGILSSLVQANGFLIIPEQIEGYEEGHEVEVELFRPVEHEENGR